ncbi:hypothetical protein HMPREF1221_00710 [Treponema socranskii subsp. paredis ATCC 35535]|nr:hypothetical protein HMPREF1221_00710 [Treponema socranskii subsp. paredis ATCC 35535]
MNLLKKKGIRLLFAAAFVTVLASCTSVRVAEVTGRVRVIRTQEDMNALLGFNGGWSANSKIGFLNEDVREWKAADTGLPFDGVVIERGANIKVCVPGKVVSYGEKTLFVPAGKFIKVKSGAKLQIWSGKTLYDFDTFHFIVGGTGTNNPEVSQKVNSTAAASVLNDSFKHAIDIDKGGTLILGSNSAKANDSAVLWLADGRSTGADGNPSPYAGSIRIDGDLQVVCGAGAGVAKIRTVQNLRGTGSTLTGSGRLYIRGLNKIHGNAIFAINEFDRGEYSDGMDWIDEPYIKLGTIEIVADGIEGIYNPDGTVDGSPGYRNNATAGFYYVAPSGTIDVDHMIVKCTNKGTTADATVALANFNTERGILGGKVTETGPKARLGDVYVYNAAVKDKDGPLSAIYTVQGVFDATVDGKVKVECPNGGAAAIVATGHNRWTGAEKTISRMGSVEVTSKGKNAFFQSAAFDGFGTYVKGDVTVSGRNDGKIAPFIGAVPPGPDMGKGGKSGVAPEAEDVRNEQFVVQGGIVDIGGKVSVVNTDKNFYTLVSNEKGSTTTVGSLFINGTPLGASENAVTLGTSGQSRFVNEGTFTIKK